MSVIKLRISFHIIYSLIRVLACSLSSYLDVWQLAGVHIITLVIYKIAIVRSIVHGLCSLHKFSAIQICWYHIECSNTMHYSMIRLLWITCRTQHLVSILSTEIGTYIYCNPNWSIITYEIIG